MVKFHLATGQVVEINMPELQFDVPKPPLTPLELLTKKDYHKPSVLGPLVLPGMLATIGCITVGLYHRYTGRPYFSGNYRTLHNRQCLLFIFVQLCKIMCEFCTKNFICGSMLNFFSYIFTSGRPFRSATVRRNKSNVGTNITDSTTCLRL